MTALTAVVHRLATRTQRSETITGQDPQQAEAPNDVTSAGGHPDPSDETGGLVPIMMHDALPDHKTPPADPLTWGEQQQALLLLRYWHEAYRGGLEPTPTVHLMTELLLAAHPART